MRVLKQNNLTRVRLVFCYRINPLYIDETNVDSRYIYDSIDDEECTGQACKTEYLHSSPLRDDSIAVIKHDPDLIRSILVSVRLGRCHQRSSNGLTPIPEGKVDSIPRPVWPNDDSTDNVESAASHLPTKEQRRNRHHRRPARSPSFADSKSDGGAPIKADRRPHRSRPADSTAALLPPALSHILRELSHNINNAMENADRVEIPADAVLRSLRTKINSCLETISAKEAADYAADSVADLYERASGDSGCVVGERSVVATLSRAFSFVNAFHKDGSHPHQPRNGRPDDQQEDDDDDEDVEKGRLMLLKRLGRFPPPAAVAPNGYTTSSSHPGYERLQRSSSASGSGSGAGSGSGSGSSSSCASTSGFSDLTHTPVSSNSSTSDSPPASRLVESSHCGPGPRPDAPSSVRKVDVYQPKRSESSSSSSGVSGEGSAGSGGVEADLRNECNDVKAVGIPSFTSPFPYHAVRSQTTASGDVPSRSGSTCSIVAEGVGCLVAATTIHSKTDTLLSVSTYYLLLSWFIVRV